MTARPMPAWCADNGEIARLLRYLNEHQAIDTRTCIDIVSKPWNWDPEYQEMCRAERTLAR